MKYRFMFTKQMVAYADIEADNDLDAWEKADKIWDNENGELEELTFEEAQYGHGVEHFMVREVN